MAEPEPTEDDGARRARTLIEVGADLAGALGGVGSSLVAGPFAGAAIGVAITRGVKAIGALAQGEKQRVGAALALIEQDAREHQERGERPRDDGFFDDRGALRPEAVDLLEGVLRQAAASYEQRKVALFARLFSETAHNKSVSSSDALFFVRLTSDLTYRQLVILSAYAAARDRMGPVRSPDPELDDLGERYLLGVDDDGTPRVPGRLFSTIDGGSASPRTAGISEAYASEAERRSLALMPTGQSLARLTGAVEVIPESDRADWVATTH